MKVDINIPEHVPQAQLDEWLTPLVPEGAVLPERNKWMIAADFALIILSHIEEKCPPLVVELGSGYSTLIIGHALKKAGRGRLVSIEHDPKYCQQTQAMIAAHGLHDVVALHLSPLQPYGDAKQPWYGISLGLFPSAIDLLIIDGPPGYLCAQSRYPALPALWETLAQPATIMLDDASRTDEQSIVRRWLAEYPQVKHRFIPTRKGTSILVREG